MIEVDVGSLRGFEEQIQSLGKDMDWFFKRILTRLANQLGHNIVNNTPVDTGELRHSWFITDIVKNGDTYEVYIVNNKEYASYVEYGHRQEVGRYVPVLGKRLKKGWIKGQRFMTKSVEEFETIVDDIVREEVEARLKEVLGT